MLTIKRSHPEKPVNHRWMRDCAYGTLRQASFHCGMCTISIDCHPYLHERKDKRSANPLCRQSNPPIGRNAPVGVQRIMRTGAQFEPGRKRHRRCRMPGVNAGRSHRPCSCSCRTGTEGVGDGRPLFKGPFCSACLVSNGTFYKVPRSCRLELYRRCFSSADVVSVVIPVGSGYLRYCS